MDEEAREDPAPPPSEESVMAYDDRYDSSCDELEVEDLHEVWRRRRREDQHSLLSDQKRDELRCTLERVKQQARRGLFHRDPYPPKNCFGCKWDNVMLRDQKGALNEFKRYFHDGLGGPSLELHCINTHHLFMEVIYPHLPPSTRRVWRSWHIYHHLEHHSNNAHVQHYFQMQKARKAVKTTEMSLYGPTSMFARCGVQDNQMANTLLRAQRSLVLLIKEKPSNWCYNSPGTTYNAENNSPALQQAPPAQEGFTALLRERRRLALPATAWDTEQDVVDG